MTWDILLNPLSDVSIVLAGASRLSGNAIAPSEYIYGSPLGFVLGIFLLPFKYLNFSIFSSDKKYLSATSCVSLIFFNGYISLQSDSILAVYIFPSHITPAL